jgi:hypothetical protein
LSRFNPDIPVYSGYSGFGYSILFRNIPGTCEEGAAEGLLDGPEGIGQEVALARLQGLARKLADDWQEVADGVVVDQLWDPEEYQMPNT